MLKQFSVCFQPIVVVLVIVVIMMKSQELQEWVRQCTAGPEQIHVGCKALRVGGEALFLLIANITGVAC